jgi:ribosomal protein S18 acetylase RimI-like enzyme
MSDGAAPMLANHLRSREDVAMENHAEPTLPPTGYRLRSARPEDFGVLAPLFAALADFDVPEKRNPDHLWQGDLELARRCAAGDAPQAFCDVLVQETGDAIHGFVLVSLRAEHLSGAPSAHLEAIAVHPNARRRGLGATLLAHAEQGARARGAESITLNVFERNVRARALYQANGYDEELIRCMKWL